MKSHGWLYPRFYSRVFKDDCAVVWLSPSHTHSHTPSKGTTVCSSSLSESEQKLCSNPGSERLGSGFRWWKQKDNDHALFGHVIILCPKTHHCNGQWPRLYDQEKLFTVSTKAPCSILLWRNTQSYLWQCKKIILVHTEAVKIKLIFKIIQSYILIPLPRTFEVLYR